MEEVWKPIVIDGEEWNYEVSDTGIVRNNRTGNILKPWITGNGYLQVALYKNGERKQIYVHQLVANAFIVNPNNLPEVNHKDENKKNNRKENLEWMSHKDNVNYGTRTKRQTKTISRKVMAISLNEKKVIIFQSIAQAEQLGFKRSNICNCCQGILKQYKGYIWKYI